MNMRAAIAPRSDVMNAEDLLTGERTFTVARAEVDTTKERAVSIWFEEFPKGRPFKPSLTVSRIFAKLWGEEEAEYVGRKVTLYRDETVKWAGQAVGGIRVRAMSHIGPKAISITLAESEKSRKPWTILPLKEDVPASPVLTETEVKINALRHEWRTATPERQEEITAEVAKLSGKQPADPGQVETPEPEGRES